MLTDPDRSCGVAKQGFPREARTHVRCSPGEEPLDEYRKKRDFTRTGEPSGSKPQRRSAGDLLFVVQKHDATRLHYDFRLEIEGVLASWAVPKGPSLDPSQKRLAVPTEDHPLDYAAFEGVIPEGEYGAGPVIVWDTGTYRSVRMKGGQTVSMKEALEDGRIEIEMKGAKLQGAFALFRTAADESGRARWLLVKKKDAHADPASDIVKERPESALSGRTIEEVAKRG